jgi:hypothetical protein
MRALFTFALTLALVVAPLLSHADAQDAHAGDARAAEPTLDRIRLAEIVPALAGTELGAIDLGAAPPPGATRVVRRAEIVATLAQRGRSSEGLVLPRETRIARRAVRLTGEEIADRARASIEAALAPCDVASITITSSATLGEGALAIDVSGPARPNDGATIVRLDLRTPGGVTHVPARVELRCPEPVIVSGSEVTVVVQAGRVRASGVGTARQSGRVGDEVRVRMERTGVLVTARVIDAQTVEVTP